MGIQLMGPNQANLQRLNNFQGEPGGPDVLAEAAKLLPELMKSASGTALYEATQNILKQSEIQNGSGENISPTSDIADALLNKLSTAASSYLPADQKRQAVRAALVEVGNALKTASPDDQLAILTMLNSALRDVPGLIRHSS